MVFVREAGCSGKLSAGSGILANAGASTRIGLAEGGSCLARGDAGPMIRILDQFVEAVLAAAKWLALPIVVLLFLQWPLRSLVGAYSSQANDLGQWLFALYVAASITAATRAETHLAADTVARRYSDAWRERLQRAGALVGLIPWSIIVLVTSRQIVLNSVAELERFPETFDPGYFLIKVALWLLALLILIEGVITLLRRRRPKRP